MRRVSSKDRGLQRSEVVVSRSEAFFSGAPTRDEAVTACRVNTFHPGLLGISSATLVSEAFMGDVRGRVSALITGTGLASKPIK